MAENQNQTLEQFVQKLSRRSNLKMLFVGLFIFIFGVFMVLMGVFKIDQTASAFVNGFLVVFGIFVMAVGGLLLFVRFKKSEVRDLILKHPHLITSVQIQSVFVQPGKRQVHNLIVTDNNGKQHVLLGDLETHHQIILILKSQHHHIQTD